MIYTCTTNPSLDHYLKLNKNLDVGEVNRVSDDHFITGGKGVNVSIELNNLMIPSVATGFLGGFVKDYYLERLSIYHYIRNLFWIFTIHKHSIIHNWSKYSMIKI